jgi:hypothetical protein
MPAGRKRNDLVFDVGTDPLRAQAIGTLSAGLLTKVVMSICPQTQAECAFGAEGPIVDPSAHRGYVAGPLSGVWAVAPVFAQRFSTDIKAIASALVADEYGVFAGEYVVQPN